MEAAIKKEAYEDAAAYRDQIDALNQSQQQSDIPTQYDRSLINTVSAKRAKAKTKSSSIVISSRLRLARNINPFLSQSSQGCPKV